MTFARAIAAMLVAGGVSMAAVARDEPLVPPRQIDDEWLLASDFHVHAFSGDGTLLPVDLAREARRHGLHVIAITNHNTLLATRFIDASAAPDVLVIPGEEITTPAFHLAAINVTSTVSWRGSLAEIARNVHAQGGAVILAHPGDPGRVETPALIDVDGVEVAHSAMHTSDGAGAMFREAFERARSVNNRVAPIGSTDFHGVAPIGLCRTFVFARERTTAGVIDAIKRGRTVACDQNSQTQGPADLVRKVGGDCAAAAAHRLRWPGPDQLASAAVWTGLVLLLVAGPRRNSPNTK